MSKFFKALEQAERERARQATTPSQDEGAPPRPTEAPIEVTQRVTSTVESAPDIRKRTVPGIPVEERGGTRIEPPPREPSRRTDPPARIAEALRAEPPPRTSEAFRKDAVDRRGQIDQDSSEDEVELDAHLVSLVAPTSFAAEEYRRLRLVLEQRAGLQLVAVTSSDGGDGKTTTAINLAGALAQSPLSKVLLIDADLRHPSMADRLGLNQSKGLVDLVQNPVLSLERLIRRLPAFNLSVLPAGRPVANEYELLRSPRLTKLLEEARQRYQFIILDVPPLPPVPDCRVIGDSVDGFIVVVAAHKTTRRLLDETLGMLEPEKVVGLVFNRADGSAGRYYYPNRSETSSSDGSIGAARWWARALGGGSRRG
jgi:capsular exopolysaccharide synthesis family protein